MKCFEIEDKEFTKRVYTQLTVNMKCFEMFGHQYRYKPYLVLTVNMKCFEIKLVYWSTAFL